MERYFFEAFDGLERLGPGSERSTMKAISLLDNCDQSLEVLDIGSGIGVHTLVLAKALPNARITAIDNHEPYIRILNRIVKEQGFSERVMGKCISMFEMPFANNSFDVIWAEGAIYIAGFEKGLLDWNKYLKKEGYLICSEISWLTDTPAKESYEFWQQAYLQIDTISNKIKQIGKAGYTFKSQFILPESDWFDHYYIPLQGNLDVMREKYVNNETAQQAIAMIQKEINLYQKYSSDYSYVFYAMVK